MNATLSSDSLREFDCTKVEQKQQKALAHERNILAELDRDA